MSISCFLYNENHAIDEVVKEKSRYMVVFHVSTFILLLHYAGG